MYTSIFKEKDSYWVEGESYTIDHITLKKKDTFKQINLKEKNTIENANLREINTIELINLNEKYYIKILTCIGIFKTLI